MPRPSDIPRSNDTADVPASAPTQVGDENRAPSTESRADGQVTVYEFAVVPIELYDEGIAATTRLRLGTTLLANEGWAPADSSPGDLPPLEHFVDFGLLTSLGLTVQPERYARATTDDSGHLEYLLFFGTAACRLYCRQRVAYLESFSPNWQHGRDAASRSLERADALTLAVRLHLWLTDEHNTWISRIIESTDPAPTGVTESHMTSLSGDPVTRALAYADSGLQNQIAELISKDQDLRYSAPFSVVLVNGESAVEAGGTGETATTKTFQTTIDALNLLHSLDDVDSLSDEMKSKLLSATAEDDRAALLEAIDAVGRYRSSRRTDDYSTAEHVADSVARMLSHHDLVESRRSILASIDQYSANVRGTESWVALRDRSRHSWLFSNWDTSVLITTDREQFKAFVALQVALESVWNHLDLAARNLPEILSDARGDIDGNRALRSLSEHALRVAGWRTRLAGWQRLVLEQLRSTYKLDDNIRDYFRASEEYVRHEELSRERVSRQRAARFQGAFAIGGLTLAALVLAELTISIAAANAHTARTVSEAVGWITFPLVAVVGMWLGAWLIQGPSRPWPQWQAWLVGLALALWLGWELFSWQSRTTEFGLPLPTAPVPILGRDVPLGLVAWPLGVLLGPLAILLSWWAFLFLRGAVRGIRRHFNSSDSG